jgi:hypothetical protein
LPVGVWTPKVVVEDSLGAKATSASSTSINVQDGGAEKVDINDNSLLSFTIRLRNLTASPRKLTEGLDIVDQILMKYPS